MANQVTTEQEFEAALIHFCFTQAATDMIVHTGLINTHPLIGFNGKDIVNIMKIVHDSTMPPLMVSYIAQKKLMVMTYWTNHCHGLAKPITARLFTLGIVDVFTQLMTYESQKEDQSKFKVPNEFKAGSKWKPFKEGAMAYFNSI
jgi:hypothetical protein